MIPRPALSWLPYIAALAIVIGCNLIWFGIPFPNPVYAKLAFAYYNTPFSEHLRDVGNVVVKRYWFLFIPASAYAVARWKERGAKIDLWQRPVSIQAWRRNV